MASRGDRTGAVNEAPMCQHDCMRSSRDRDDEEPRPPRTWRLVWILLGVVVVVVLGGGGVVLGMSAPPLPGGDTVDVTDESSPVCDDGAVADEAARLCYAVPDGWVASSIDVGVGPTSTLTAGDSGTSATAHFGPVAALPIPVEGDLPAMVEAVVQHACALFDTPDCDPNVGFGEVDGHESVSATAGAPEGFITVTVVEIDGGYSYALSVADEVHRADTDAIHASLTVI